MDREMHSVAIRVAVGGLLITSPNLVIKEWPNLPGPRLAEAHVKPLHMISPGYHVIFR